MEALVAALFAYILIADPDMNPIGAQYPPAIERIDEEAMWRIYYGPDKPYNPDSSIYLSAVYDGNNQIVYLGEDWEASNLKDVAVLLHELYHHLQYASGDYEDVWCAGQQLERPAYDVQFDFLRGAGVEDVYEFTNISPSAHMFATSCGHIP